MSKNPTHVWRGKADFGHVYNKADPREYFQAVYPLGYQAPAHGKWIFTRLVQWRRENLKQPDVVVLDLCCSYGINAALLNHDLTFDALGARYCSPELATLATDALVSADRAFYHEHRRADPVPVLGIDVANKAVAYAQRVGLHWAGSSENLEVQDPGAALARLLSRVDLIIVTGGIGYITERTFDRVLRYAATRENCWVAAFALRWVNYERIAKILANYRLSTEKLVGHTFRQRRFANERERHYVLDALGRLGIDPTGKETTGWYHSNFFLSHPEGHPRPPLHQLLAGYVG